MFDTGHAVSMTTADGAEVLIHVGIDTVQLNGQHYKACCKAGDRVKKGDLLIEFDPEAVKAAGYETVTPVIICNTDRFAAVKTEKTGNKPVYPQKFKYYSGKEVITMKTIVYTITDELGIHARPAGMLVKEAAKFQSKIMVASPKKEVDAKRIMGVMSMGAKKGDPLKVTIEGPDEDAAAEAIEAFLKANL